MQKGLYVKSDLRSKLQHRGEAYRGDFELSNYDCYGKPNEVNMTWEVSGQEQQRAPPAKPVISDSSKEENRPLRESLVSFLLLILQRYLLISIYL